MPATKPKAGKARTKPRRKPAAAENQGQAGNQQETSESLTGEETMSDLSKELVQLAQGL
jgi:hypothetical protein